MERGNLRADANGKATREHTLPRAKVRMQRCRVRKDYPECRPILLHRGPGRLEIDAIPCWPVEDFLSGLRPGDGGVPGIGAG